MPTIVMVGEALVEIMRTERDSPLDRPGPFEGPFPSGAPAIAADAAAQALPPGSTASVGFIGGIGADAFGDCVRHRLLADGIDCTALRVVPDRLTGIAFVAYRSDGSRNFVFHLPDSAAAAVTPNQVPEGYLDDTRYLHIMGSSLSIGRSLRQTCYWAADVVHAAGGIVSLDPNLRPELMPVAEIRSVCEPILERAQIVFPSGEELLALTGADTPEQGAEHLLSRDIRIIALKQGAQGSTIYTQDGVLNVPAYRVTEVDPTGAGDCFDAAFLVGLSEGWDLEKTALFANAVGGLATTRLGPMEGIVSHEQVLQFMADQGRPLL